MLFTPQFAQAQVADNIVLNILRECAKIENQSARLACYDNNIRSAGAAPRNTPVPTAPAPAPAPAAPQGNAAPAASSTPQGFGAETVRAPRQREQSSTTENGIRARVTNVTPRQPGIYLLTLEDGAQWVFAEGVTNSYRVPERGSTVEIERGSLGSFLLRFNNQSPVPVRRVQ